MKTLNSEIPNSYRSILLVRLSTKDFLLQNTTNRLPHVVLVNNGLVVELSVDIVPDLVEMITASVYPVDSRNASECLDASAVTITVLPPAAEILSVKVCRVLI